MFGKKDTLKEFLGDGYLTGEKGDKPVAGFEFPEVVIERTKQELDMTSLELKAVEVKLLNFMFMSSMVDNLPMTDKDVDVLWHNFILDTKSYIKFCYEYVGVMIHHSPNMTDEKVNMAEFTQKIAALKKKFPKDFEEHKQNIENRYGRQSVNNSQADDVGSMFLMMVAVSTVEASESTDTTEQGETTSSCSSSYSCRSSSCSSSSCSSSSSSSCSSSSSSSCSSSSCSSGF